MYEKIVKGFPIIWFSSLRDGGVTYSQRTASSQDFFPALQTKDTARKLTILH